jgi:hypothetical protein
MDGSARVAVEALWVRLEWRTQRLPGPRKDARAGATRQGWLSPLTIQ